MGQIADDILDGSCCAGCNQFFEHPSGNGIYCHDFPVICWDCIAGFEAHEILEAAYPPADVKTYGGDRITKSTRQKIKELRGRFEPQVSKAKFRHNQNQPI